MLRRIAIGLALALASLTTLVVLALALVQTGFGRAFIERQVALALAAPDGAPAEVEGLQGFLPFDIRLKRLALADREGVWLRVEDLHLDWSPLALLRGLLHVEALTARRVEVLRPPAADESEPEPEPTEPFRLPELPDAVPSLVVDRLAVDQIALGAPVLGEPASFSLNGELVTREQGRAALLDLALARVDQATARASLQARLELNARALDLAFSAEETGGLLAAVSGLPEAGDLAISLNGAGPLSDWTGRLEADAQGLAQAEGTLRLAAVDQPKAGLVVEVRPTPSLVPDELERLLGERIGISLDVVQTAPQALALEELRVVTAAAELTGNGRIDLERDTLAADAALEVSELASLSELAGTPLEGSASLSLRASGAPMQPSGQVTLEATDLAVADARARRLETTLDVRFLQSLAAGPPAVEAKGEGGLSGLELAALPELPISDLTWRLDVGMPADGRARISTLELKGGAVTLAVEGALDRKTLAGDLEVSLDARDLASLTSPFGQRVEGDLSLESKVAIAQQAEQIGVRLTGALDDLGGLPPGAAELLGRNVTLAADAEVAPGERVSLRDLLVEGAESTLSGDLGLGLENQDLEGAFRLTLPRLAALEPLVQQGIAGSLVADATLGGTLASPTVQLETEGQEVALAGQAFRRVLLTATAEGLPDAPEGAVRLGLEQGKIAATLSGKYRLADQALRLSDVALNAPSTRVGGAFNLDLDPLLIDGSLKGGVRDLAALEPLIGLPLRGQVDLDARLSHPDRRQRVAATLNGGGLRAPFGELERVELRANVRDALAKPQIEAEATVTGLSQADLRLAQARVQASGTPESWRVRASANGQAVEPFDLESEAEVTLADAIRVRLTRLSGSAAEQPIRLAGPATLVLGDAMALQGLDLRIAGAEITGDARLGGGRVEAEAALRGLSLALLSRFGAPDVTGQANATLRLTGAADNPQGTIDIDLSDLKPADPAFADVPPVQFAATARLAERRLNADLRAEGLTDGPVAATVGLPVVLRLDPFEFATPQDGELSGRFAGQIQLGRIDDLVYIGDQSLEGLFTTDLTVGGTIARPRVDGTLSIADGSYANGTTGTVLRRITLKADVSEQQLTVAELSATDGGRGRLSAEGEMAIEPARSLPYGLRARLREVRLIQRDDVDATVSARLELTGDLQGAKLGGTVTVDRLEATIPEGTGPQIATLEVVEVGGNAPPVAEQRAGQAGDGFKLILDLTVNLPARVFVRGLGLESEWSGRLQVRGPAASPLIVGHLEVRRGRFDFLNRRFDLRQGTIEFTGSTPPEPQINLEAASRGGGITALVRLTGPASQPQLQLTSDPVLPEDEVLSRLLFNQPLSEVTPAQAAQLALAVNQLRGGGPGVLGQVRTALGVDTLDVGGGDTPGSASVRAGKYLSDDVYVEVEQGTDQASGKARVEIEILPNVSLEADTSQDANSGIGIQWRFDY
jgi:translocation and assembly module TamB